VFALRGYMRAALLLSAMFVIGGVLAALGYPVVYIAGRPVVGASGLLFALICATLPPLVVFWFRWLRRM
jgi:membrane associated rhomboid family serine protease